MEATKVLNKKKLLAPKLRFKGFSDEWQISKIEKILHALIDCEHKTAPYIDDSEYLVVRTNNVRNGNLIYDDIKYTTKTGFEEWTKRGLPRYGDILFTREAPAGESCLVPKNKKICLGQRMVLLKPNDQKVDGPYLSYYLQSNSGIRNIDNVIIGTTVTRINIADIYKLKCPVTSLIEQQKISSFLSAVDEKIQLLTCKKELLEQYKKGVIQQLFSGRLRFKDKNGKAFPKWKEKRLDEVVLRFIVPMRDKPKDLTGPIPWCRIEDFDGKYLSKSKSGQGVDLKTIKEMNLKVYPVGTLLVSCSANLGFCAITTTELVTNQTFIGLFPDDKKADISFLFYVMRRSSVKLNTLSSGTTISYLSREQFEKFKIPYPDLFEQKKLANYISKLDNKIDSVDKQITQTQIFKKGLLQQMFV